MAEVLYLEDELWQIQGSIATVLEIEYGHSVETCSSLGEAARRLSERSWDVIVADVMMTVSTPIRFGHSVFALINRIRDGEFAPAGNGARMPIVCASGVWDMKMTWEDGERIRVVDAMTRMSIPEEGRVTKPLSEEELNSAIEWAIGQRDSQ